MQPAAPHSKPFWRVFDARELLAAQPMNVFVATIALVLSAREARPQSTTEGSTAMAHDDPGRF